MKSIRYIVALLACLACSLGLAACGGSAAGTVLDSDPAPTGNPVAVSPMPGTPDASPDTQISFLGDAGTRVSDVHAVGSRSGAHAGVLRAYSTGTGESFLPTHPFVAGERVTVTAQVSVGGVTREAKTGFEVAHEAPVSEKEFPINHGDPSDVQHYSTAPMLTPSTVTITTPAQPGATPGDFFLAPYQADGSPGPMIVDQHGNLVWFHPLAPEQDATDFGVQRYEGKPVLVWWQGRILQVGFGQGEDEIYNSSYQHVATVRAGNGYHADLHEIRITPEGTAWIDAFDPIHANLTSVHRSANAVLEDSVIQEIDVKTGLVMWEWHALGHIPIAESNNPPPTESSYPWDYIHVNSADPGPTGQEGGAGADQPGDVLLSARNSWTLYDVDLLTGAIRWRLGGAHSDFKLGSGARFYWQHDAEWQPGGLISLFDNGSDPPKEKQSRGLLLDPDASNHTVKLVKQFVNPHKTLLAESQGDTLSLPGGNWLMGYGRLPNFTEYSSSGHVLFDATLGPEVQDFRTYFSAWSAQAPGAPSVLAQPAAGGGLTVSVSWNGATEVASWRVLAGASPASLAPVATAPKAGFQTTISAPGAGPYVAVQALDASGAAIGTSATVRA
jgi:Arylsulfotransferase (ASST)